MKVVVPIVIVVGIVAVSLQPRSTFHFANSAESRPKVGKFEEAVGLVAEARVCHTHGGCECVCDWADEQTCQRNEGPEDGSCCFDCCCEEGRPREDEAPQKSARARARSATYHAWDEVEVLQLQGPSAPAVVLGYLGERMYRVQYKVDKARETVSEGRLSFGHNDFDRETPRDDGEDGGAPEDDAADDEWAEDVDRIEAGGRINVPPARSAGVLGSALHYMSIFLCIVACLALAAALAYLGYYYCRFPKRLPLREGAYVVVTGEIETENKQPIILRKGDRGQVLRIDRLSALIDFYDYEHQWVSMRHNRNLLVSAYGPVPTASRLFCG